MALTTVCTMEMFAARKASIIKKKQKQKTTTWLSFFPPIFPLTMCSYGYLVNLMNFVADKYEHQWNKGALVYFSFTN